MTQPDASTVATNPIKLPRKRVAPATLVTGKEADQMRKAKGLAGLGALGLCLVTTGCVSQDMLQSLSESMASAAVTSLVQGIMTAILQAFGLTG